MGSPFGLSWDGQESELGQPVPCGFQRQRQLFPTEGEEAAAVAVVAAGAAALRREKRSRPRERVRVLGVRLQSFCLSL